MALRKAAEPRGEEKYSKAIRDGYPDSAPDRTTRTWQLSLSRQPGLFHRFGESQELLAFCRWENTGGRTRKEL